MRGFIKTFLFPAFAMLMAFESHGGLEDQPRAIELNPQEMQSLLEKKLDADSVQTLKGKELRSIPWKTLDDIRSAMPTLNIPTGAAFVLVSMALPVRADEEVSATGGYFSLPIAMIFAREVLEAAVIYTNYRTAVNRTDSLTAPEKKSYLKAINWGAASGITLGAITATAVGLGVGYGGRDFDEVEHGVEIAEGISKLIASFFVAHFSLEIPKWLGVSNQVSIANPLQNSSGMVSERNVALNLVWNLFREFGEIGIFLVPAILAGEAAAIPGSGAAGIAIAGTLGAGYYFGSKCLNKKAVAIASATLVGLLATGLFEGALHEFEEVAGETPEIYDLGEALSHKNLPLALLRPFGYSSSPTVLETVAWWSFAAGLSGLHIAKHYFGVTGSQIWKFCRDKLCGSAERSMDAGSAIEMEEGASALEVSTAPAQRPALPSGQLSPRRLSYHRLSHHRPSHQKKRRSTAQNRQQGAISEESRSKLHRKMKRQGSDPL